MTADFSLLIVCTGNVHRSALAHDLLATWAGWYLPAALATRVHVVSAGTRAPVGVPMGGATRRIAAELGAEDRGHRAALLTADLVESADLILASAREHRAAVLALSPRVLRRTFTIREAGRIATAMRPAAVHEDGAALSGRAARSAPSSVASLCAAVVRLDELRPDYLDPLADDVIDPEGREPAAVEEMVRQEVPALVELARVLWGMPPGDVDAYLRAVAQS
ncbi:hypothetical protein Q9S36_40500 [Microbacterium sp. ARD31]|uniref:arsenate reductase/protein-tyrosine-phosphatase family protein n=1 Tax=Microbacterium sp. ARD31 TaxID=2962576 RepID=UPI00288234A2|nr:hypothetical protein [Microbacterium sp. ARD31]MDT0186484.1 hypothetical protein [Microbacterium sp. ARD31]